MYIYIYTFVHIYIHLKPNFEIGEAFGREISKVGARLSECEAEQKHFVRITFFQVQHLAM